MYFNQLIRNCKKDHGVEEFVRRHLVLLRLVRAGSSLASNLSQKIFLPYKGKNMGGITLSFERNRKQKSSNMHVTKSFFISHTILDKKPKEIVSRSHNLSY